jgi:putative hydrolase of HD superfamily
MDQSMRVAAETIDGLKRLRRAGWRRCGVAESSCESVAEHTFGVALLAMLLPQTAGLELDRGRCVMLALVHDLAEASVGDITPHDGVDPVEKRRREEAAMRDLAQRLGDESILSLWLEFEAGREPRRRGSSAS